MIHCFINWWTLLLMQPRFTVGTRSLWFLYLSRKFLCALFPMSFVLATCCSSPSCIPRICISFFLVNNSFFMLPRPLFWTKISHFSPPSPSPPPSPPVLAPIWISSLLWSHCVRDHCGFFVSYRIHVTLIFPFLSITHYSFPIDEDIKKFCIKIVFYVRRHFSTELLPDLYKTFFLVIAGGCT